MSQPGESGMRLIAGFAIASIGLGVLLLIAGAGMSAFGAIIGAELGMPERLWQSSAALVVIGGVLLVLTRSNRGDANKDKV